MTHLSCLSVSRLKVPSSLSQSRSHMMEDWIASFDLTIALFGTNWNYLGWNDKPRDLTTGRLLTVGFLSSNYCCCLFWSRSEIRALSYEMGTIHRTWNWNLELELNSLFFAWTSRKIMMVDSIRSDAVICVTVECHTSHNYSVVNMQIMR